MFHRLFGRRRRCPPTLWGYREGRTVSYRILIAREELIQLFIICAVSKEGKRLRQWLLSAKKQGSDEVRRILSVLPVYVVTVNDAVGLLWRVPVHLDDSGTPSCHHRRVQVLWWSFRCPKVGFVSHAAPT